MNDKTQKAWLLFINTFSISMTANSGYAILSVLKNRFVEKYKWFTIEEMDDFIAMAQSSPGPIAVNSSMLIGYQAAGLLGAFAAVLGVIIPPFIVMIAVTFFYNIIATNPYVRIFISGMQAGVVAMLVDVVIGLFTSIMKKKQLLYYVMVVFCFLFVRLTDLSIFYLALICIAVAIVKTLLVSRKAAQS